MSNFFNSKRFMGLLKSQLMENKNQYLMFYTGGAILLATILLLFVDQFSESSDLIIPVFVAGLYLTNAVFVLRYFKIFTGKGAAILYLLRPASVFEKWLAALVVTSILYPLFYVVVFFSVIFLFSFTITWPWPLFLSEELWINLPMLMCMQAGLNFGCLYFRGFILIKSFALQALLQFLLTWFLAGLFDYRPSLEDKFEWFTFIWFALPCFYWILSYFILKNRQA